jgi:hypothetical protein
LFDEPADRSDGIARVSSLGFHVAGPSSSERIVRSSNL